MTPREVIARAIYEDFRERESALFDNRYDEFDDLTNPIQDSYLWHADAVIDALASMEPTEAMRDAYTAWNGEWIDASGWRAMVGAMRDE